MNRLFILCLLAVSLSTSANQIDDVTHSLGFHLNCNSINDGHFPYPSPSLGINYRREFQKWGQPLMLHGGVELIQPLRAAIGENILAETLDDNAPVAARASVASLSLSPYVEFGHRRWSKRNPKREISNSLLAQLYLWHDDIYEMNFIATYAPFQYKSDDSKIHYRFASFGAGVAVSGSEGYMGGYFVGFLNLIEVNWRVSAK